MGKRKKCDGDSPLKRSELVEVNKRSLDQSLVLHQVGESKQWKVIENVQTTIGADLFLSILSHHFNFSLKKWKFMGLDQNEPVLSGLR